MATSAALLKLAYRNRNFLIPVFFLYGFVLAACTGSREAFDDRVATRKPTVQFGCDTRHAAVQPSGPLSSKPVLVRNLPDPNPLVVGKLFGSGLDDLPVHVEGRSPSTTLAMDVKAILENAGFNCAEDSETNRVLEVAVSKIRAVQIPAKWYEVKGRVIGRVEIIARLKKDSDVVWTKKISKESDLRVVYFLTSQMEVELNKAYCQSLHELENDLRSEEFLSIIER
ncbi:MAG: hypothetical protein KDC45_05545 [Bacteroidetes bacterium]|nr:hypothetical protein [Bacteroidota bacterium]